MKIIKEKLGCVACDGEIEIGIMFMVGPKELYVCESCHRYAQRIAVQAIELTLCGICGQDEKADHGR